MSPDFVEEENTVSHIFRSDLKSRSYKFFVFTEIVLDIIFYVCFF